jgi:LuxR family transcriptional regulator, maltose regulon positive regulatory protein
MRLNEGLHRKLTLISAPAGFGKTTVLSDWVAGCQRPVAWLSLDPGDSDPSRFLGHVVASIQTVSPSIGVGVLSTLHSPQPPPDESILTVLINEIADLPAPFVLMLDDYHTVDSRAVDEALTFLLENLPRQLHLVIGTREDPHLPLAKLRARGQLTEIRAENLRFNSAETSRFLNDMMALDLSDEDVAALDARTEGWIAGLQLAAISLQGHEDATSFIKTFTGSHRFVLDYLVEEVLQRQPEHVQKFLLRTSILDRMCGSLCDALLDDRPVDGQEMLRYLEQVNLFTIPLDSERRWYRYHHLFAELLRQRLHQAATAASNGAETSKSELHMRASEWFEHQGLEIEAFHHAAAAGDIERAERLVNGGGSPLYVRGGVVPVLSWLRTLPTSEMDARPSLWVMFATALAVVGRLSQVEPMVRAAEVAMTDALPEDSFRQLTVRIADLRALVAVLIGSPDEIETIISHSRRVLDQMGGDNLAGKAALLWRLGLAYQRRGDRAEAELVHLDAISASEATGNIHVTILAKSCIGILQESANQLDLAEKTYRRVLELVGDPPGPVACEAFAGMARIYCERNDLDAAEQYGFLSVRLARQLEITSFITSELAVGRLKLARGDAQGAIDLLAQTEQDARSRGFTFRLPEIAAMQVRAHLLQGNRTAAQQIAGAHDIPISQARVHLALGNAYAALELLEQAARVVEERRWSDQILTIPLLQAIAHDAGGDHERALHLLQDVLASAESSGFVRTIVEEGEPMARLLVKAANHGIRPEYVARLLAAFDAEKLSLDIASTKASKPLIEPLSQRELEVLRLVAQGLSNREISDRLFVALNTVKGHNRVIFSKLQVQRRTEAIARARQLGLL